MDSACGPVSLRAPASANDLRIRSLRGERGSVVRMQMDVRELGGVARELVASELMR